MGTPASSRSGTRAPPPWRDIRVLRIATQVAVLAGVVGIGALLALTLSSNITGTRLGFDLGFLGQRAGFEISDKPIAFSADDTFARAFAIGIINTLLVSAAGLVLATALGVVVGVARLSPNWLANRISAGYVEVMRNTPLLVQLVLIAAIIRQLPGIDESIELPGSVYLNSRGLYVPRPETEATFGFWILVVIATVIGAVVIRRIASARATAGRPTYGAGRLALVAAVAVAAGAWMALSPVAFDVPERQRFNFTGGVALSPGFTALLLGLVIYTAAFIGEVVRGGIQAVRRGQIEAAHAIGLTPGQTLRLVVFPQALRIIVPPLTSQYLNLIKNSSLALAVGYADLFAVGRAMANQTGQPLSVIALLMATYLSISLLTSLFMNIYNRRVQVAER